MMHITLKDGTEISADTLERGRMKPDGDCLIATVKTGEHELSRAIVDGFKDSEIEKIEVDN